MSGFRLFCATAAITLGLGVGIGAEEAPPPSVPRQRCLNLVEAGRAEEALPYCREALGTSQDRALRVAAATAETEEGDPEAACRILEGLRAEGELSPKEAALYARALLRSGRPEDAEAVLRQSLAKGASLEAFRGLLDLRLSLGRAEGAGEDIRRALAAFPGDCRLREVAAALYGLLGRDGEAAEEARQAVALGCEPLGWARRAGMAERLGNPAYRPLLNPAAVVSGLSRMADGEARFRLQILEKTMGPEAVPALAEDLLRRSDYGIRLREIHLLLGQGPASLPALEEVLGRGDLFLRKMVLRQLLSDADPRWIPLLEKQLEREAAPGNRTLAALALAKAYAAAGRRAEAAALLRSVPEGDPLYPEARELLEKAGLKDR
ncbi:MAG: tetratricopeptide repeat protein [Acidobacteriota bacterium]